MRSILLIIVFIAMSVMLARFEYNEEAFHSKATIDFEGAENTDVNSSIRITQQRLDGPYAIELYQFESVWRNLQSYKHSRPEKMDLSKLSFNRFGKKTSKKMNNLRFTVPFKDCLISADNPQIFNCGYKEKHGEFLSTTVVSGVEIHLIAIKSRIITDESIDVTGDSQVGNKYAVDLGLKRKNKYYNFRVETEINKPDGEAGSDDSGGGLLGF